MKEEKLDGFQLQHKNPENNRRIVTENGEKIYWLNLSNFVYDLIKAFYEFFSYIETKPECIINKLVERANRLIIVRNLLTGEIYNKPSFTLVDPIFSPLDLENIEWNLLEDSIYRLCLEK